MTGIRHLPSPLIRRVRISNWSEEVEAFTGWTGSRCQGPCARPRTRRCQADVEAPVAGARVDGQALVGEDGRVPIG